MLGIYREIENSYIENFSNKKDKGDHIVFWDEKLPDMHAFNCVLIKDNIDRSSIGNFALECLEKAKSENKDFLKIYIHPEIEITEDLEKRLQDIGFETDVNLYMKIEGSKAGSFRGNDECSIIIANSEEAFEQGRDLDIETSTAPAEFTVRKTLRKKEVFQDPNKNLRLYLCCYENRVIGKCELHIKDGFAKIEDFDVKGEYQRRGFGTAILKRMISDAAGMGIKNIYLITGKNDTPREMYSKLGFGIMGEELELFWHK